MAERLPSGRIPGSIPQHVIDRIIQTAHASKYNFQNLNKTVHDVEILYEQKHYPEVMDACNIILQQEADEPGCTPLFQLGRLQKCLACAFIQEIGSMSRYPLHINLIQVDLTYLQISKPSTSENSFGAHREICTKPQILLRRSV
jgi:hypothetical protein